MRILEVYIFQMAQISTYYTKLRVYRASTENGTYSLIATQDLDDATGIQTVVDNDGGATDFYKYTLYKDTATTAETSQQPIGRYFCRVGALKTRLDETSVGAADDMFANCVASATRQVRNYLGRNFYQTVETRYFEGKGLSRNRSDLAPYTLWIDDCVSLSAVVLDYSGGVTGSSTTTLTVGTHVYLWPQDAPQRSFPYTGLKWIPGATLQVVSDGTSNYLGNYQSFPQGYRAARLTGTWGFPADPLTNSPIPADVEEATLQLAARLYKGKDNAYSRAIGPNEFGQQQIADAFFNADTKQLLAPYKKVKL